MTLRGSLRLAIMSIMGGLLVLRLPVVSSRQPTDCNLNYALTRRSIPEGARAAVRVSGPEPYSLAE